MLLDPVSPSDKLELSSDDASAPKSIGKGDDLQAKLDALLERLGELQNVFYADGSRSLLIILQGRDASGKDGVVRTVIGAVNPGGVRIENFKTPTPVELAHDYLWRIHNVVPAKGMMGIFNRSHYEDVLVVRVRSLVTESVWSQRYDQINAFEKMLSENGTVILKFFLHVSHDEQKERLRERVEDPTKNWKFNANDLEERKLWDDTPLHIVMRFSNAARSGLPGTSCPATAIRRVTISSLTTSYTPWRASTSSIRSQRRTLRSI